MSDVETITRLGKELRELEAERARVQRKLTDICGDIWDAARRYGIDDTSASEFFVEDRATLRRIFARLSGQ